jgi:predicted PhzF superfamily epimerase YddE/YHI9
VVGTYPPGSETAIEVRAFFRAEGNAAEDPVTGSLIASVAQWLLDSHRLEAPYIASQGTRIGRSGRVYVDADDDGTIWVGGAVTACITGSVNL